MHAILIKPFQYGHVDSSRLQILKPNGQEQINHIFTRGKIKKPVMVFDYFRNIDSIQVIWDDSILVTHMIADSFQSNNKFIGFGMDRNMGNINNFKSSIEKETKRSVTWSLTYTFAEEDYLYAKD